MGLRRQGRELALQTLYALELNPMATRELLRLLRENQTAGAAVRAFAEELVAGVMENRAEIDRKIEEGSKNWSVARISKVDLSILRMAVYELFYRSEIPKNVSINEAIEVAKKFGTEESPAFVNGILDEISALVPE